MGLVQALKEWAGFGPTQSALNGGGGRAYDAGRYDIPQIEGWDPTIAHPDDEILNSRDKVVARPRDLARNHPIIAGAVDRRTEAVVGPNIQLEAQPDYEAMGKSADWADDWATKAETQWNVCTNDVGKYFDAARVSLFGGQVDTAYRHWMTDGEACATILNLPRGGTYSTAVRLVDPDRLSNPNGIADGMDYSNGNRIYGGVEVDRNGAAVAYHVRVRHPGDHMDIDGYRWERVKRESTTGRPLFIHAYRPSRADQRRGVSRFAAAIKLTRIGDRLDTATLDAAILNAFMAVSVESPYPTSEVRDALAPIDDAAVGWSLEKQIEYRAKNRVRFNGPVVRHYLPGEQTKVLTSEHPSANYPEFEAALLRKVASAIGMSYPQISQNWADINYSSARTLLNEIWRSLLHDRWLFTQAFCTPIYVAWLEEAVAIGKIKVPGGPLNFYKWRAELSMCSWMGPGRGVVDPKKESDASDLDIAAGRSNLAIENAEQGRDYRKVLQGEARVRKFREKLGLEPPPGPKASGPGRPADENTNAADIADQRETAGEDA